MTIGRLGSGRTPVAPRVAYGAMLAAFLAGAYTTAATAQSIEEVCAGREAVREARAGGEGGAPHLCPNGAPRLPPSVGSFPYADLSVRAKALVDDLVGGPSVYEGLTYAQQTTLAAILHALEAEGLLDILTEIICVWGEAFDADGSHSTQGMDQFRLSVTLTADTARRLTHFDAPSSRGHVKLPSSVVTTRGVVSVRQLGGPPSIQVSWLREDVTCGEIDIDYVRTDVLGFRFGLFKGHMTPENSDVREHVNAHERGYRSDLVTWWVGDNQ